MDKSVDRELGELIGTVNELVKTNERWYNEINTALSSIRQQFSDYITGHDAKHVEAQDAVDSRVTYLERRVKVLEDAQLIKKGVESSKLSKFIQQFAMSFAAILATGVAAFIFWLFVQFITNSKAIIAG